MGRASGEHREAASARPSASVRRCRGRRCPSSWQSFGQGYLPGLVGIEFLEVARGRVTSRLTVRPELMAPNGYLHAATVIALADTLVRLRNRGQPPGRRSRIHDDRAEIELPRHGPRGQRSRARPRSSTAAAPRRSGTRGSRDEATGRVIALFRCTQLLPVLPREAPPG